MTDRRPILVGVSLALASAAAFGVTIPFVGWAGAGVGPFATASLLYLGACVAALVQKAIYSDPGTGLSKRATPTLLIVVLAGAAAAPTLFAWGLQRTGPVTGGLILNLEAVWTVVLARIVFGEFLGRRVAVALVLMVVGGALLTVRNAGSVSVHFIGILAVVAATVAWAIDNTASRQLSELQPASVVAAKGGLGALTTGVLALAFNEAMPKPWQFAILLLAGATGYGASLRIYLLAQRRIGAARTASVFALAPFIGAAVGAAFVPGQLSWEVFVAAGLFGAGVALHASERHSHRHQHDAVEHEHTHSHQDGHHSHQHSPPVEKHSHVHRHEPLEHDHDHGMDLHHGHRH